MPKLAIALLIGMAAGTIDVLPMIAQKLDPYACWSAFLHYLIFGVVVTYLPWPMAGWLKGLVLGVMMAVPVMVMVMKNEPASVIPIAAMAVVLGALTGWVAGKFGRPAAL